MCGIGGVISIDPDLKGVVPLILNDQRARGPDSSAMMHLDRGELHIVLGHNRLAILDLTNDSNQPFVDPDTGAYIVFNGEIYNYLELKQQLLAEGHQFRTASDTEVLLKAFLHWGPGALRKFNGMFAFAVWDPRSQQITLARDRFGVKPCYYFQSSNRFAFASTTSALAGFLKLQPNLSYLFHGVTSGLYEDADGSAPFQEMRSLPPGHYLTFDGKNSRIDQFYSLEDRVMAEIDLQGGMSTEERLERLDEVLRSAVKLRLRSDVPVTLSLSGGLDSALLGSYIREISTDRQDVFTFGCPTDSNSEATLASESARKLGFNLHFATLAPERLVEQFERTLDAQGAPFAHPSVVAQNRVFELMHDHGFKVSIGGQGADEVFMGYRKFQFFNLSDALRAHDLKRAFPAAWGLALMLKSELGSFSSLFAFIRRYVRKPDSTEIFMGSAIEPFALGFGAFASLRDRQIADMGYASLSTLLRYEDRNSMGHSVESRMPFLDYRVVELGLALSAHEKVCHGYGKWILRRLAEKRLPDRIVHSRSKLAFALSTNKWLNHGLGEHLYQEVNSRISRLDGILSPACIERLKQRSTYADPSAFALMVTSYWMASRI